MALGNKEREDDKGVWAGIVGFIKKSPKSGSKTRR
jgi:hypothetical protein